MLRRCLALIPICALAACASAQSAYPSLAIRPGERESGALLPVPSEPVLTPVAPATLDRVSKLAADARAAHQAFVDEVAGARDTITAGRGAVVGDDAWAKAEAALADVRAGRAKTMIPLADLDILYDDAATHGQAPGRIGTVRDEVAGYVTSEDRTLDQLAANLP